MSECCRVGRGLGMRVAAEQTQVACVISMGRGRRDVTILHPLPVYIGSARVIMQSVRKLKYLHTLFNRKCCTTAIDKLAISVCFIVRLIIKLELLRKILCTRKYIKLHCTYISYKKVLIEKHQYIIKHKPTI